MSRLARILAGAVLAAALFPVSAAFAMMGSSDAGADAASSNASAADLETLPDDAEQLGLMPHLWRLTGNSMPASWDATDAGYNIESVGALFPDMLDISTTPTSISVGKECSMDEVCGFDPCTCGKPDAWGHCACGGFKTVEPAITITFDDETVAHVADALGTRWIVPDHAGTTHVSIRAELEHYLPATYEFDLQVMPFGLVDILLALAALVLVAAVAVGLFFGIRALVRWVRKRMQERRAWVQRGAQLKEEHPLTWRTRLDGERHADGQRSGARKRHAMPFVHDMLFAFKQALPVLLGGLALFAVLVPISTTVVNDISIFNVNYTHEQLKYQLYAQDLSFVVNAAAVAYGAVLALALFRFLLVKRATTAFFSVGLSRTHLFVARSLVGAVCIVLGIAAPFAISLMLNGAALGFYDGFVGEALFTAAGYVLVALVAFALAAIACACAGTLFEACAFACALLLGVSAVLWSFGLIAQTLLVGNAQGMHLYGQATEVLPSLLSGLWFLNPVLFFMQLGADHQFFMALHPVYYPEAGPWWVLLIWFAVFLALMAAALAAFCHRPGEQAEMAGKCPWLSLFSVAVAGLAVFACALSVLASLDTAVAVVVGLALFVLVSLVLLFGPLRGRASQRFTLGCVGGELACMVCAVLIVAGGAFGFSSRIPDTADVANVEVSYNGSPSFLTEGFAGVSGGASYYYTSNRTYSAEASVDIVRAVHEQLIGSAQAARETDFIAFQNTVVPYDVVLRYELTDGTELCRYFSQASIGELSALLALDNDARSHELENAVITGNTEMLTDEEAQQMGSSPSYAAFRNGAIYAADGILNRILPVECDDLERAALLQAIAADMAELSAAERYASEVPARAVLMFTMAPEADVASFGYSFSDSVLYVTDDWANTLAWMESAGLMDQLGAEPDPRAIEQLTFQLDDPYASINKVTQPVARFFMGYRTDVADQYWITQDFGALKSYTDQEHISQILPSLRLGTYMTGGYLVQAKLRGISSYVYFYLPAEYVPEGF